MRRLIYILFICVGFLVSQFGTTQAISSVGSELNTKSTSKNELLYFSDATLKQDDAGLVAGHYSHRSHASHQSHSSHYSSR